MLEAKVIKKSQIKDLLKEIVKEWDTLENICLEDENVPLGPKDVFFPQLEAMFAVKNGKIIETTASEKTFLFGIKACDLKGILFLDDFFQRNFPDKYYLTRIKERFTAVMGCIEPPRPDACFCTSTNTGPFLDKGFDWQFVDTGDSYIIEIGSEKGKDLICKFKKFFKDPIDDVDRLIRQIKLKAANSIKLRLDFQKALKLFSKDDFIPEENYKRIAERCIYCGGCLYVCPTCTCFNVFDTSTSSLDYARDDPERVKRVEGSLSVNGEHSRTIDNMNENKYERYRNWDTCVFEGYTREASGYNPREEKWQRTQRRYEHKLKYDYKTTGMSGCVGCGRCLKSCPVNIGISRFIQEITEDKRIM